MDISKIEALTELMISSSVATSGLGSDHGVLTFRTVSDQHGVGCKHAQHVLETMYCLAAKKSKHSESCDLVPYFSVVLRDASRHMIKFKIVRGLDKDVELLREMGDANNHQLGDKTRFLATEMLGQWKSEGLEIESITMFALANRSCAPQDTTQLIQAADIGRGFLLGSDPNNDVSSAIRPTKEDLSKELRRAQPEHHEKLQTTKLIGSKAPTFEKQRELMETSLKPTGKHKGGDDHGNAGEEEDNDIPTNRPTTSIKAANATTKRIVAEKLDSAKKPLISDFFTKMKTNPSKPKQEAQHVDEKDDEEVDDEESNQFVDKDDDIPISDNDSPESNGRRNNEGASTKRRRLVVAVSDDESDANDFDEMMGDDGDHNNSNNKTNNNNNADHDSDFESKPQRPKDGLHGKFTNEHITKAGTTQAAKPKKDVNDPHRIDKASFDKLVQCSILSEDMYDLVKSGAIIKNEIRHRYTDAKGYMVSAKAFEIVNTSENKQVMGVVDENYKKFPEIKIKEKKVKAEKKDSEPGEPKPAKKAANAEDAKSAKKPKPENHEAAKKKAKADTGPKQLSVLSFFKKS